MFGNCFAESEFYFMYRLQESMFKHVPGKAFFFVSVGCTYYKRIETVLFTSKGKKRIMLFISSFNLIREVPHFEEIQH